MMKGTLALFQNLRTLFHYFGRAGWGRSKEQEILSLMLLGHGNKAIGIEKNVMADTVKKHRAQIMAKMEVNSLAELLSLCKDSLRGTS